MNESGRSKVTRRGFLQGAAAGTIALPYAITSDALGAGAGMVTTFASGIKMILEFTGWRGTCGVKFEGADGWASVADGYGMADFSNPKMAGEYKKLMSTYQAESQRPLDHMQDFLTCVKSRRDRKSVV